MTYYRKLNEDGTYSIYNGKWINTGDSLVINPTVDILTANGYEEYTPEVTEPEEEIYTEPSYSEVIEALKSLTQTTIISLSDSEALKVAALYPTWESKIGQEVSAGDRLWYNNALWKVIQAHTVQSVYPPSTDTAALYTQIVEESSEAGTADNPIAYSNPMELVSGKYYTENGVTYLCTRDLANSVWALSDLVGTYVSVVE